MKTLVLLFAFCYSLNIQAQENLPEMDKSPMDMSYAPADYPLLKIQNKITDPLVARVIYSRPQKNNRIIFGELLEYGKVWRLGANEATEIEFYQNVTINNVKIKKGRYSLYAIPYDQRWVIIINKDVDTWGSFKYDEKKDLIRVGVPVEMHSQRLEAFVMAFAKSNSGYDLQIAWDDVSVTLPISLK